MPTRGASAKPPSPAPCLTISAPVYTPTGPSIPNGRAAHSSAFHPDVTEVVDVTSVSDQMKIFDTVGSAEAKVTVIDVRAGLLSSTLQALSDIGFIELAKTGQITFAVFHILGPSIASLEEIAETARFVGDANHFLVKNHINETSFFEWDPAIYKSYFKRIKDAQEITIPKLNEMTCEQVEVAGVPYVSFVANKNAKGETVNNSFVLRGYVRHWLSRVGRVRSRQAGRLGLTEARKEHPPGRRLAASQHETDAAAGELMSFRSPVAIIASPRPRVGKTLLARLLTDFHLQEGRPVAAFDLNAGEGTLAQFLPEHVTRSAIDDLKGQMALFDRLMVEDGATKIVDVGRASFETFFALANQFGFAEEAHNRGIVPTLLYLMTPDGTSVESYRSRM